MTESIRGPLGWLRDKYGVVKAHFYEETAMQRERMFAAVRLQRDAWLQTELQPLLLRADTSWTCDEFVKYANRCDWVLVDTLAFAACLPERETEIVEGLVAPLLMHLSIRLVDDAIDHHDRYKGGFDTLIGAYKQAGHPKELGETISVLLALALAWRTGASGQPESTEGAIRTVAAMVWEALSAHNDTTSYEQLAAAKMGDFGMLLYGPVVNHCERSLRAPLTQFLRLSLLLGQMLNDLHDATDDKSRGQVNFWNQSAHNHADRMNGLFRELACLAYLLPAVFQPYCFSRMVDLANYGLQAPPR